MFGHLILETLDWNPSSTPSAGFLLRHPLGDSSDDANSWVPPTHMGDLNRLPGSWLYLDPALAIGGICRMNQYWMAALCLIVSLCIIDLKKKKKLETSNSCIL